MLNISGLPELASLYAKTASNPTEMDIDSLLT